MIIRTDIPHEQMTWSTRYGDRHRLERIIDFPRGVTPPEKVRIYWRLDHFVLQWWDRAAKRNLSDRVNGDLVAAIMRARQIDERLRHFKSAGLGCRRISHHELVERFIADLRKRADASEIDSRTVARYESAIQHYMAFCEQPETERSFPSPTGVNREFVMQFSEYLSTMRISPNGHPHAARRRMSSTKYVEDVVRAMLAWSADPERGNMMPDGFRNPLEGSRRRSNEPVRDLFGDPDITLPMAVAFVQVCDKYQLRLFSLLMLYGLRAAEPCFLFQEQAERGWLNVNCDPQLDYFVKGRRDKRLPMIEPLTCLLGMDGRTAPKGLIFQRRSVDQGRETPLLNGLSREALRTEYEQRCQSGKVTSAEGRRRIRDQVFSQAGGLRYDQVEGEFQQLARRLGWSRAATLKDFRHLFSTSLENAGMPEFYRRYFMGQSPGKSAVVNYTHLNQLRERYEEAVKHQLQPLVNSIHVRLQQLGGGISGPSPRAHANT
jgi:hypothetical protein